MVIDDPSKWQGPRIKLKVGSKAMFKFLHPEWPILASVTLSDWQDNQLVQETETVTYFLNSSTPKDHLKTELDSGVGAAQSCLMISFEKTLRFQKLRAFVSKKTSPGETVFTVWAPPGLGYYKLVISAARVPRVKAKVMMPVVATFLVGGLQPAACHDEECQKLSTS